MFVFITEIINKRYETRNQNALNLSFVFASSIQYLDYNLNS